VAFSITCFGQSFIETDSVSFKPSSRFVDKTFVISVCYPFCVNAYKSQDYSGNFYTRGLSISLGTESNHKYIGGTAICILSKDSQFGTNSIPYTYSDGLGSFILWNYIFTFKESPLALIPGASLGILWLEQSAGREFHSISNNFYFFGSPNLKIALDFKYARLFFKHSLLIGTSVLSFYELGVDGKILFKRQH
jgi:hypothetical protein